jgi:4-hydroxy-tetrahydrodipicolinate synthase
MYQGSIVALITPFRDGVVDESALQALVEWHIGQGTQGIVSCGTTGESPTLTHDEHRRVTELCVEAAAGRVPVIAGTGSNATDEAVALTRHAAQAGASAVLVVAPYYNRPTQEGLYQHFRAVHDCAEIPVILYNIPSRCMVDLSVETMARLAELPRVVGLKDATNNIARISQQRARLGPDFLQLSGEDAVALAAMVHGAHGCISVTANVAPAECAAFQNACLAGAYAEALQWQDRLFPLHEALFLETNPSPVKYAASLRGLCDETVRLPMVPPTEPTRARVRAAMQGLGLLNA